nr:MAG TPA: hypothetical protein [Caudoviricetes sp.]
MVSDFTSAALPHEYISSAQAQQARRILPPMLSSAKISGVILSNVTASM